MEQRIETIINEIKKVIKGKDDIALKTLIAIIANGHILFDDIPGVGKTTLAVTLGKALGLKYNRVQFTPDVLPSDIVGFSVYNKATGGFDYKPGAVSKTNILLGDEINRTSSKTQSALLEVMEEYQVTVDGKTYDTEKPFIVLATQNNVGTAGTQLLPYAQLDRFLVKLSLGYPDFNSQLDIIKDRQIINPIESVNQVVNASEIIKMQNEALQVTSNDEIVKYITSLAFASRECEDIELGISPRGAICINRMAKARAFAMGRSYVIPEDVKAVFVDTCSHRIILSQKTRFNSVTSEEVLKKIIDEEKVPDNME